MKPILFLLLICGTAGAENPYLEDQSCFDIKTHRPVPCHNIGDTGGMEKLADETARETDKKLKDGFYKEQTIEWLGIITFSKTE